jgi:TRAP-type uncharacterized transport system fused permease subunit
VAVGWASVRQAWIAFLIPFLFIYQPAILMQGTTMEIIGVSIGCLVAIPLVTGALLGYALAPLGPLTRLVWLAFGLLVFIPFNGIGKAGMAIEIASTLAGLGLLTLHWQEARRRPEPQPA